MRPVMEYVTHLPPRGTLPLKEGVVRYMFMAATLIVRHIDVVDESSPNAAGYTQLDRMVIEACSLTLLDGMPQVDTSHILTSALSVVEHARGMVSVAKELVNAEMGYQSAMNGLMDYAIMRGIPMPDVKGHDFVRVCRTLNAFFE